MTTTKDTKSYVYAIYNTINGKLYIGITVNCEKRWRRHKWQAQHHMKHKHAIHWALMKYGLNHFIFKCIAKCNTWKDACQAERKWIAILKQFGYQLYNETDGGEGSFGVRRYGVDNPSFGKPMQPHVKKAVLDSKRIFTDQQIKEIRKLFEAETHTQTQLSKLYGVALPVIHDIVKYKKWNNGAPKPITTPRLKATQVLEIRNLYKIEGYSAKELAEIYHVSVRHIFKILRKEKWKDI